MKGFRLFALAVLVGILFAAQTPRTQAQVSVSIGVAPVCPYGYFDYPPYDCAPYGYYGPEWFDGGVFIGAGPWFHGAEGFHGHVDNHFDPKHGFHGALPKHDDKADWASHHGKVENFKGNEVREQHKHADDHK